MLHFKKKNMKVLKKITIFSLLVASIIFSSCEDDFLDKVPTDSVASTSATETTGNLDLIINGINRSLYVRYGAQGRTGIGSMMIQMETLGEDYVNVARANGWFIGTGQWLSHTDASSANCEFPYRTHYQIIRNANTVINLGNEAVGPEEDKNKAIAQALTYRAWSYFWIVQLYGERYVPGAVNSQLGVPLRLDLGTEPIARNTVEEVYTQINQDLDDAIVLFGDVTNSTGGSSLTSNVANGLKARVNLVQGNYAIAAQFAEAAQEGPTLMNTADYFNNFSNASSGEWMWGSVIQEDQTDLFGNFGAWISRNFSSSNIRGNPKAINSLLYDQISDTDVRKSLFDPTGEHLTLPAGVEISGRHSRFPYTNQKFVAAGEGDSRMDTPYMRVSEMYLIEAEVLPEILLIHFQ